MKKKQMNLLLLVVIVLVIIGIVVGIILLRKNTKPKNPVTNEMLEGTPIDPNDPAYEGMEIYEQDGDIIIESKDGAKTIQSTKKQSDSEFKELDGEEQKKYELSNVNVENEGTMTVVTGTITNKDNVNHTAVVNVKFRSAEGKIIGAASEQVSLSAGQTSEFKLTLMDDLKDENYDIMVEYAK